MRLSLQAVLLALVALVGCRTETPGDGTAGLPSGPPATTKKAGLTLPVEAGGRTPGRVTVALTADELAPGSNARGFRYAYNGAVPGPTIRAQVGDEVEVTLTNALDQPTTIHWHGLEVPWAMDGVIWMQDPIAPGAQFTYRFTVNHAGTFWYHPHFDTAGQVDRGLYGLFVVEDPTEPATDEDWALIFDDHNEDVPPHKAHGHGRQVRRWLVNGEHQPTVTARGGQTIRARILNASNAGYVALRAPGLRQIAGSQGLLASAAEPEFVLVAPGDRAEIELRVGQAPIVLENVAYSLNGGLTYGKPIPVLTVAIDAPAAAAPPVAWPFAGGQPTPDPGRTDVYYSFFGSDRTGRWTINGEQFPNVTVQSVARGASVVIEVRNVSPSEHPFHLHGQHFEVLSIDGVAPAERRIADTLNVRIHQRVRLLVEANNPGDWMAHCHILPHAEQGMMTVFRVRE